MAKLLMPRPAHHRPWLLLEGAATCGVPAPSPRLPVRRAVCPAMPRTTTTLQKAPSNGAPAPRAFLETEAGRRKLKMLEREWSYLGPLLQDFNEFDIPGQRLYIQRLGCHLQNVGGFLLELGEHPAGDPSWQLEVAQRLLRERSDNGEPALCLLLGQVGEGREG